MRMFLEWRCGMLDVIKFIACFACVVCHVDTTLLIRKFDFMFGLAEWSGGPGGPRDQRPGSSTRQIFNMNFHSFLTL